VKKEIKDKIIYYIIKNNVRVISPIITSENITYPFFGEERNINEILEELAKENILIKKEVGKIIVCPNCKGFKLVTTYLCPFCFSPNIKKRYILQHQICGYTGLEEEIKDKCPLCKKDVDLKSLIRKGFTFICLNCGQSFITPSTLHKCINCNTTFTPENSEVIEIYEYIVNEEKLMEVKEEILPLFEIQETLLKYGFKIKENKLKGNSGIIHEFDIIVEKENKIYAIDIVSKLTLDRIFNIGIKRIDITDKNINLFLIILQENIEENIINLIKMYNIKLINGNYEKVINYLKNLENL